VADSAAVFADTATILDLLANDSDPEGGALRLVSASAVSGTVAVEPGGRLLYTPAPGFTGTDTVTYTAADPLGAATQGTAVLTVASPALAITANADGTLTVDASLGAVTITVASPAEFAGSYTTDTGLLAGGPVNLAPPVVEGTPAVGQTLTARAGLWITTGTAPAESFAWRRDGAAIPGAAGASYTVTAADAGRMLTVAETLTDAAGSRTAASGGTPVPGSFAPADDPALLAWYDASDAATVTATGGLVSAWASKAGAGSLSGGASPPRTGLRTIGGCNALDFAGTNRLSGGVTLPASGNVAIHAVLAIDSVTSAFAAALAMDAARDFQIDAASATQFSGRLNATGIGDTVALSGGPFTGTLLLSVVFDRTGAGTSQVWINGALAGSGAYATALDSAQMLLIMANRSQNAFVDGAVGEVVVTGDVTNRAQYEAYLAAKWGIV
jgi:hypothetical protein